MAQVAPDVLDSQNLIDHLEQFADAGVDPIHQACAQGAQEIRSVRWQLYQSRAAYEGLTGARQG